LEYSTILVEGNLRIINTGDSSLRVQKIIVGPTGSLTIGTNEKPIEDYSKVKIVFVKNKEGELGIFVFGKLEIYGKEVSPTFVELKKSAKLGEKKLVVNQELKNWQVGDTVVITSPGEENCNEVSEISKIDSQDIFLKSSLNCFHRADDSENSIVSHIALLSRNIIFSSEDKTHRGSVNFFHGSTGYVKYAQFDKLGPKEVLGRYPIHFHHLKDSSRGIEVIGNSITNSDNRWITIHDSNGILVRNNVGYISQGHGYFLEDGNEFDNIFENNIGIITKRELILHGASSVFWTQNPMNEYRDNVAVNGYYWGFLFEIPNSNVELPNSDKRINLRSLPSLEFEGNTAYNFRGGGMKVIRPIIEDETISSSEIIISNFHAMGPTNDKHLHSGIFIAGSNVTISNSTLLNNIFGIIFRGESNKVLDTQIKMERKVKLDSEISGILIAGGNNLIENSEINGYISKNNNPASDISVSNNQKQKRLMSAKIINTTLLDPLPIYFGKPANENSFLEIYGYDAPTARIKKVPQNFMLKAIGSDTIEQRGEYNNFEFDAMIKMIPDKKSENQMDSNSEKQINNFEKTKSQLIKNFKNKAVAWEKNNISDAEFLNEIEILFESQLLEIRGIEYETFQEFQFIIPQWVKKLVDFWFDNSISDEEFINAIEYVLKRTISERETGY